MGNVSPTEMSGFLLARLPQNAAEGPHQTIRSLKVSCASLSALDDGLAISSARPPVVSSRFDYVMRVRSHQYVKETKISFHTSLGCSFVIAFAS